MKVHDSKISRWLFSTPYRALHRAYEASKKVRNIQRDYFFYKNSVGAKQSKRSFSNVTLYIDNILNQSASNIFWSLLEFKISINLCNFIASLQEPSAFGPWGLPNLSLSIPEGALAFEIFGSFNKYTKETLGATLGANDNNLSGIKIKNSSAPLNIYTRSLKQKLVNCINILIGWKTKNKINSYSKQPINGSTQFTSSIEKNCFFLNKFYNKNLDWERWNRKLTWIEAVLIDLEVFKNKGAQRLGASNQEAFLGQKNQYQYTVFNTPSSTYPPASFVGSSKGALARAVGYSNTLTRLTNAPYVDERKSLRGTEKGKDTAYESLGLVPRSITRTLSRFQTELAGRSASLVLPEFRLAKYQAITSLKYLAFLILCPWISLIVCKMSFGPLIENWWNTAQFQIFLSFSQEEKALKRLQQVEELLWLDIIMADSSAKQPQDLSAQIHQRTIDLVETYNQESIQTILHFFTNFIFVFVFILLLIWGKKRLAILNSWVQEVFYSLSDTMKAFFILLFTDLCIGFHSPHGWEIFIGFILEHLGFSHNKHVISCFVSTFPVILDTVFKYWIFRHLNRISPSIVVSYHTMNE
jgi:hypothetical protein